MKFVIALLFLASFSSQIFAKTKHPDQVICQNNETGESFIVTGISGETSHTFPANVENPYERSGEVSRDNGQVYIDYADGCDIENIAFSANDLAELKSGKKTSISAEHETGFWHDKAYTEMAIVSCQLN